jgi:hypothetical protein
MPEAKISFVKQRGPVLNGILQYPRLSRGAVNMSAERVYK